MRISARARLYALSVTVIWGANQGTFLLLPNARPCALGEWYKPLAELIVCLAEPTIGVEFVHIGPPDTLREMHVVGRHTDDSLECS